MRGSPVAHEALAATFRLVVPAARTPSIVVAAAANWRVKALVPAPWNVNVFAAPRGTLAVIVPVAGVVRVFTTV